MRPRFLILLGTVLLLNACGPKAPVFDPASVQNEAGAAVVRNILSGLPAPAASAPVCIVVGEEHLAPAPEFVARFSDLGRRILPPRQCDIKFVGGIGRVVELLPDKAPGGLVVLVQLASLTTSGAASQADAGWAYQDESLRRKYEITTRPDGGYDVSEGEIIKQSTGAAPAR